MKKSGLWHEIEGFKISNKSPTRVYDTIYMYRRKLADAANFIPSQSLLLHFVKEIG